MCGFVVTTDINNCQIMLEKQSFRGPDGMRVWKDKNIALGHALLDISGEKQFQPYKTKRGNYLVWNGEMYDTNIPNDTKYLADGLDTYGFKFLEYNDWHGAFALYNPNTQELTFGRDHFGTKPLWADLNDGITLTTSLRSLLRTKENKRLKEPYIVNSLMQGTECPYQGVIKIPPGGFYNYNLKTKDLLYKNFWRSYSIRDFPFKEEDFKEKLVNSIRKIAKNKQKTGLFLSGGFDSTMVLSAVKDMGLDLTVYICAYDDSKGKYHSHDGFRGEARLAAKTCDEWGIPYKAIVLDHDKVYHYDRDWLNKTHMVWSDRNRRSPRYALCQAAAMDGCKVILTGDSADELFSGYIHFNKYWIEDYKENKFHAIQKEYNWFPRFKHSETDYWNNMLLTELLITSEQNVLATDQTCGMFGMESRPCFLGQNFVRYNYQFPGTIKFKQDIRYSTGTYKWLLREVMKDWIPEHVRNRKQKVGWSSPWDNNHKKLIYQWRREDWEYIQGIK